MDWFLNNNGNVRPLIVLLIIFLLLAAFNTYKKVENMSYTNIEETNNAESIMDATIMSRMPKPTGKPQGFTFPPRKPRRVDPMRGPPGFTIGGSP